MWPSWMITKVIWPDVFSEPLEAPYRPDYTDEQRKAAACADQLMAWGNCHLEPPPENFGYVMMKLGKFSGCLTSEQCSALADEITNKTPAPAGG